jgi:hypothetical protein
MSGKIEFIGEPPFDLPVIQSAEARLMGEHVEMTLRIALPNIPQLSEIKAQMLHGVALSLGEQLRKRAIEAELKEQQRP